MPKKAEAAPQQQRIRAWKCPDCGAEAPHSQMESQPKICTTCGQAEVEPVYEEA